MLEVKSDLNLYMLVLVKRFKQALPYLSCNESTLSKFLKVKLFKSPNILI